MKNEGRLEYGNVALITTCNKSSEGDEGLTNRVVM